MKIRNVIPKQLCDVCNKNVKKSSFSGHRLRCLNIRTRIEMEAKDYIKASGQVCLLKGAKIPLDKVKLREDENGRVKSGKMDGYWGPRWAVELAKQVSKFYLAHIAMHMCSENETARGHLNSLSRMGGNDAIEEYIMLQSKTCCRKGGGMLAWYKKNKKNIRRW